MSETDAASGKRRKVARLIDRYDLGDVGAEMERRWTADGEARMSLRALADWFNRRLLAAALAREGVQTLSGDADSLYRLLTDDGVSTADRTRAVRRLEREGLDPAALTDDFVTYQAVRTYLTKDRGAAYAEPDVDRRTAERENLARLRGRTATVTESKLERLREDDHVVLGEFTTLVDVAVHCRDCGARYDVETLLDRGGCDCLDDAP